jgi:hypothetical protein
MNKDIKLVEVLKYGDKYFEVGSVVEMVVDTYANKPVVGRLVCFDSSEINGNKIFQNIHVDTSDLYKSDVKIFDISRIKSIEFVVK